ncbi:tyrosinase family protein [Fluviicola sp.]|uniref:tyrosinase family protein n=1 Tax=Fluviicola sp. TaxID=1917219 RepID=UPI00261EB857|nr:tyrosinase family protein [Fluviicola sp.]
MKERKDVYKLPSGDKTLEWYSKAVAEMKKRPATDPTSWYYQAAIHGFLASSPYWANVGTLPPLSERDMYWERCQHQSWYFLPWHRMYLAYFEQIVANTIAGLGGPADWALPFWNYSDESNPKRLDIPGSFTTPGNDSNPLWMPNRNNSVKAADTVLTALDIDFYTSLSNSIIGFGGPVTKFHPGGGYSGGLESLPHNKIHMDINGAMGDPDTAGLDPIFWLHHANIDRLWQVWLNLVGHSNPTESDWLDFSFHFHDKDKKPVVMQCKDVLDTRKVLSGYTYEGVPVKSSRSLKVNEILVHRFVHPLDIVSASEKVHSLEKGISRFSLSLPSSKVKALVSKSRGLAESKDAKKRMFLRFENIKGKGAAPVYSVYLNTADKDGINQSNYAGSIALFGLERASKADKHHSGSGLNEQLEVTDLISKLSALPGWDEKKLDIQIKPDREVKDDVSVSIGRISLYSE